MWSYLEIEPLKRSSINNKVIKVRGYMIDIIFILFRGTLNIGPNIEMMRGDSRKKMVLLKLKEA